MEKFSEEAEKAAQAAMKVVAQAVSVLKERGSHDRKGKPYNNGRLTTPLCMCPIWIPLMSQGTQR